MILATNEIPDEREKQYLLYLVYNSVFGRIEREKLIEKINDCQDYSTYSLLHGKLELSQKSIDQIPNPSQTDIKNHINKLI